jgi:uncharacterized protein YabE (DUF348 family)
VTSRTLIRRPAALVLQGVVLAALVGGTVAWTATVKTVTISVDGQVRKVTTHGGTVGKVLADASLSAGPHDLLTPSADSSLADGDRIALRRGRELQLVVDGEKRSVWVTAASVDEALGQVGVRAEGAVLSASRSRSIPLGGMELAVTTVKSVSILADGHVKSVRTTAPTVRDALMQAGVNLRPADRISATRTTRVKDGMTIRVTRIVGKRITENLEVAFGTVRREDSSMYSGDTKVLAEGRPGVLVRTWNLNYVDGRLKSKFLGSERVAADPVTRVVAVGTMSRPAPAPAPRYSGGSSGGLNWGALANCESGGNPRSVSSGGTYRGLYQFSMGTWASVGGSGDPIDASGSEQTYRAQLLFNGQGRSPWPVCGRYL